MSGELGRATLDLDANLGPFERNVLAAETRGDSLRDTLEKIAAIAHVADDALNDVKMRGGAESRLTAQEIISGVRGVSDESREAAREIDRVKLGTEQASETVAAGDVIDHKLDEIRHSAERTRLALDHVRVTGGAARGRSGVGLGPFGSGFGRVGVLGAAIGLGALTTPAAAPAALGILAAIPVLAGVAAGSLGVLALAFQGVFKAIGGDKKAFDDLTSSQKQFVLLVRSLDGWFKRLKQLAAQSLFPGLTKGLKAALSPGTLSAIDTAVVQLGRALGAAGAQWGKYFGSARFQHIFGPLMQSAARNIGLLSDTLLQLFDAIGTIARAAIPLTNWLLTAIDKGAKLADTWLRARDATGQLAGAMHEAKDSLQLVGHLAGSLVNAVFALGQAIYPVAKVAVKLLTDGLNALAGGIKKAAPDIRGALGGVLALIGQIARTIGPVLGTLADIILKVIGTLARALAPIVKALRPVFGALRDAIRQVAPPLEKLIRDFAHRLAPAVKDLAKPTANLIHALGPVLAGALKVLDPILRLAAHAITSLAIAFGYVSDGAAKAITWITKHWRGIGGFFKNLAHAIVHAFEYTWYLLKVAALKAALAVVEPFSHLPAFLGGWARDAKNAMQSQLDRLHAPNMDWSGQASAEGAATGAAWRGGYLKGLEGPAGPGNYAPVDGAKEKTRKHRGYGTPPKPGDYGPVMQSPFGKEPAFTKNLGSSSTSSAIPLSVQHLDDLAARADAQAAALNYAGKKARRYLDKEIADLRQADQILEQKIKSAHGKGRETLYRQLTANMKKITEASKRLHEAATKERQAQLQLAVDKAKVAVENAQMGTKAYNHAVAAEKKALNAEIRYWDKRAHNRKLSAAARDAALRKELQYQRELKALLAPIKQAAAANQAEFLSTFKAIQNSFGSNTFPIADGNNGKKTDTHLYDIKNEARETNKHLRGIREKGRFPGTRMSLDSTMAATA